MLFGRRELFPAQLADQVIHLIQSLLLLMDLLQQAAAAPPQQPKPLPDCIRSLFRQPDKVLQRAQFHPGLLQKPKRNCPLQRFLPITPGAIRRLRPLQQPIFLIQPQQFRRQAEPSARV